MRYPFFATFVLFVIWFNIRLAHRNRTDDEQQRAFWRREHAANNVRKKPLDGLNYITIPVDSLPFDKVDALSDARAREEAKRILTLHEEGAEIVNFTGYSNTDLKLEYGTANITRLAQYDANYTTLAVALQAFGKGLYEDGYYAEAEEVLSFAVSTGTDISETYRLLSDLYTDKLVLTKDETKRRMEGLRLSAESIRSLSKERIVRELQEVMP